VRGSSFRIDPRDEDVTLLSASIGGAHERVPAGARDRKPGIL
jgi:hypothetical protein